jgi:RNA polymerase sigma factor (sigma-70 family)
VLEADDQARIEELADLEPIRSAVAEHFKRLSQEQRDAVQLRVVDELPYAEVARQLRVSENAARARVSRGLRELARSLNHSPLLKGPIRHDRT